ncbi:hypothetical protein MPH_09494 [Macrophomina phaseolina MS6]|uniref:Uncharacterized protein n=1 Tax=Macrophomina phaseolina (strain MS6) TaxID=1126212 RepID=K2RSK7_MACPH|nr:hypothetical protein MPH_09494 [Macrophomina phaseolina MS6]
MPFGWHYFQASMPKISGKGQYGVHGIGNSSLYHGNVERPCTIFWVYQCTHTVRNANICRIARHKQASSSANSAPAAKASSLLGLLMDDFRSAWVQFDILKIFGQISKCTLTEEKVNLLERQLLGLLEEDYDCRQRNANVPGHEDEVELWEVSNLGANMQSGSLLLTFHPMWPRPMGET